MRPGVIGGPIGLWLGAAILLALSACDRSTDAVDGSATAPTEIKQEETLLLQTPPGWLRIAEQTTDTFRLAELIPAGQDKDDWFDKLFIEANALQPLPDPIVFLEAMGAELKTECEGANDANVHTGMENGYPTSVRLLVCNKNLNTTRGEVTLIKAIKGNDNFYVISRARRSDSLQNDESPLSREELAEWSLYMRSIKLCDPRNADHPCPTRPG